MWVCFDESWKDAMSPRHVWNLDLLARRGVGPFQAMDVSHVALASIVLKTTFFHAFQCSDVLRTELALPEMCNFLRTLHESDSLTIIVPHTEDIVTLQADTQDHSLMSSFSLQRSHAQELLGFPN